ncbi:MAG: hypothetical protein ABUS54_09680 [Actinomycetota bacterium]
MPGILFVHASDDHARDVFSRGGRVYWSRAFQVVLEKYGYLDVVVAGPDALDHADTADRYDLVLVARQPEGFWNTALLERLTQGRARTLVDGPAPQAVASVLGVNATDELGPSGVFRGLSGPFNRAALDRYGTVSATRVAPTTSSKEQRVAPHLHWSRLNVPISSAQAAAWRVPTWDPVRWEVGPDSEVLAEWDLEDGRVTPALVRRGSLIGASFSIFEYLVQAHTSPPYAQDEYLTSPAPHGLEAFLLVLFDELIAEAGGTRVRVLPWPLGIDWALTVRHDYDRPLPVERVAEALARHDRSHTAATWYWRASTLRRSRFGRNRSAAGVSRSQHADALRLIGSHRRHEIALHTEQLWRDPKERAVVERASETRVQGTSAHGDPGCFRFQGAPNVLWAAEQQLSYTENLQHFHLQPYRFVTLRDDGLTEPLDLICLPKHQSFDRSMIQGETYADALGDVLPRYRAAGGLLQVMNHPDLHADALFEFLEQLPRSGRLDWTARRLASWWRATHDSSRLRVGIDASGSLRAMTRVGVSNAVVELRRPDGTTSRRVLAVEAHAA